MSQTLVGAGKTPPMSPEMKARVDSRYMQIRKLLRRPSDNLERARHLTGLVQPLCTDKEAQADFNEVAAWSVEQGSKKAYAPIGLALDVFEYISSVCPATSHEGTLRLLEGARSFLGTEARFHVLVARVYAIEDDFDRAAVAAHEARKLGSAHAVALSARLEARRARATTSSYAPGMFDRALALAETEPTPNWQVVDLAAVLSTRARLYLEIAFWAPGPHGLAARQKALKTLDRIVQGPFPAAVRVRASDVLCFELWMQADSPSEIERAKSTCKRAGTVFGHVGASVLSKAPPRGPGADEKGLALPEERRLGLAKLSARLARLQRGAFHLAVVRGDEAEVLEWAFAATKLLQALDRKGASLLVVDRTQSARASAVLGQILKRAGVQPWARVDAKRGTQTLPCIAALLSGREAPSVCPIDRKLKQRLLAQPKPSLSFLIGRDLDAEIDDLRLYKHPVVLLSFRQSYMEKKGLEAWLRSLSDVAALPFFDN